MVPWQREVGLYACSLTGAALAAVLSHGFRVDQVQCRNWPAPAAALTASSLYLLSLALMTVSWLGLARRCAGPPAGAPPLRRVLAVGFLTHLIALTGTPFLSEDVLAYAAVGRAMAAYGASSSTALAQSLPLDDPFRVAISAHEDWLREGSAYAVGFNGLAHALVRVAGDDVALSMRLFQLLALGATALTALVAARAASEADRPGARRIAAEAAALVLFSPLTVMEGTLNGHNDASLMLGTALFTLAIVRSRPGLALVAAGANLLVKASGVLLLAFSCMRQLLRRVRPGLLRRKALLLALAAAGALAGIVLLAWPLLPALRSYSTCAARILGFPTGPLPYCTRSPECLPRAVLQVLLHQSAAAWVVGLLFRAGAVLLLLVTALRSRPGVASLHSAASFLLIYYLYFHSFSQTWYLLSLLPLLPYASERLRPAIIVACVSSLAHYALDFPLACDLRPVVVGSKEVASALITLVPPTVVLLRDRTRHRPGARNPG